MNKKDSESDLPIAYIPLKPEDTEKIEVFKVFSKCWKCKSDMEFLTYHSQVNGMDNYLGSFPFVDEILLKKYHQFLEKRFSKTKEAFDVVNVCKKCYVIQGNFFQWELWRDLQSKPEHLETVTVKISDILSQEDLERYNLEEKEIFDSEKH